MLGDLATRLSKTEPDLWQKAHARAYELVREPRIAYAIEALADELVARAAKGFGMSSAAIGACIAQRNDEFDSRRLLYGQRAPRPTLKGSTPSEELARREATVREIGATRKAKSKPTPKPKATTKPRATTQAIRKQRTKRNAAPRGWIATTTFVAVIDGRRETIKAGVSWVRDGHEIVQRYPSRFRPSPGHRKPSITKAAEAAACPSVG
jgi:hypothetical protein